ncbi:hypothetical protein Drose_06335 [Dactylosporangium roseum]|uniref:Uncharacterized protein n=1 Tax=Dactylosporangium roseum TaxID=47989 RepID=A0ABY5ZA74_9ACTN|nr:hypothetical protein [Dactylosporangium roseum]UWZ37890.1 hypothetical protein Drose_06335 [Dactylosporangium roseum]
MADLHTRLLNRCEPAWWGLADKPPRALDALRAVVERHKPVPCRWQGCKDPGGHFICKACGPAVNAPCEEMRVIAEQLGIPTEDQELGEGQAAGDAYGAEPRDLGDGYHELELAHGRWYHLDDLGARVMVSLQRPYTVLRWKPFVGTREPAEQPEPVEADRVSLDDLTDHALFGLGEITWPAEQPEHPEAICHRCGGPNIAWSAPSPLWNAVMRGGSINGEEAFDGIVCPSCFARLAEERGIAELWRFSAGRVHVELETVTPSGRTWDDATWLWRETSSVEQPEPAPVVDVAPDPRLHAHELGGPQAGCADCAAKAAAQGDAR